MPPEDSPLTPLVGALGDLTRWFAECSVPGMVIGGVAASILGRPRATRDVDALWLEPQSYDRTAGGETRTVWYDDVVVETKYIWPKCP